MRRHSATWLRLGVSLLSLLLAAGALAGCTQDPPADPRALLTAAKRHLDQAETLRFELAGSGLPETGGYLVSAKGTAKRPDSFEGRFRMAIGGVAATVRVVSVAGTLYARYPFRDGFVKTDPDTLGVRDPAELLSPDQGLSSFLTEARRLKSQGRSRMGDDVVHKITARLPAEVVGRFLFVADDKAGIETTFLVDADTRQLRQAMFRGPFYDTKQPTTYTLTLDRYGAPVDIKAPPP